MEIWKDIEGYEGLYEVSNLGKVRSYHTGKVKELKQVKDKGGYLLVNLHKDGKIKRYLVHRLVAKAFLGDWSMWFPQINHKNEIKTDNSVENLEWCDGKYNINYGTRADKFVQTRIKKGTFNKDMCGRFDTSDRNEYMKEYLKEYYQANKERLKEYQREYYKTHKMKVS